MNFNLLFDNFDSLLNTSDKVKQLNKSILQLAVQGNLVLQDPSDEPVTKLSKQIKEQKARLIKEGKLKKERPLPPIKEEEIPYELPEGWEWMRLGDLLRVVTDGSHFSPQTQDEGYPYITVRDLNNDHINFEYCKFISKEDFDTLVQNGCKPEYNDVLFSKDGTVGKVTVIDFNREFVVLSSLAILRPFQFATFPYFLAYLLKSDPILNQAIEAKSGTALRRIVLARIKLLIVPLPPINEQTRIVEKIDELMNHTKEIEAKLKERDNQIVSLNSSGLHHLLNAKNDKEFSERIQFIIDNFDLLYSDERNVKELKQAILQLAVQGKLVAQDPSDEPASELINRINKEKVKLIKEGKIKEEVPFPCIMEEEIPYKLPNGWEWARLSQVILNIRGGGTPSKNKSEYWNGDIHWASVKDLNNGMYLNHTIDKITREGVENSSTIIIPKGNVILCTRMGLGKIVLNEVDVAINQDLKAVWLYKDIERKYFYYAYLTLNVKGTGTTVSGIRQEILLSLLIPLPPLNEQKRIVEKVYRLMQLCDELEANIMESKSKSEELFDAILRDQHYVL